MKSSTKLMLRARRNSLRRLSVEILLLQSGLLIYLKIKSGPDIEIGTLKIKQKDVSSNYNFMLVKIMRNLR
jgi:hypothetical protein